MCSPILVADSLKLCWPLLTPIAKVGFIIIVLTNIGKLNGFLFILRPHALLSLSFILQAIFRFVLALNFYSPSKHRTRFRTAFVANSRSSSNVFTNLSLT